MFWYEGKCFGPACRVFSFEPVNRYLQCYGGDMYPGEVIIPPCPPRLIVRTVQDGRCMPILDSLDGEGPCLDISCPLHSRNVSWNQDVPGGTVKTADPVLLAENFYLRVSGSWGTKLSSWIYRISPHIISG